MPNHFFAPLKRVPTPRQDNVPADVQIVGDVRRNTTSLLDLLSGMGIGIANEIPKGLAGIEAVTPLRKVGSNMNFPIMDPRKDDVAGFMDETAAIPNPFPMTPAGQSRATTLGKLVDQILESDTAQTLLDAESKLEGYVNEHFGVETGATLFATINAGLEFAGPAGKGKKLFNLPPTSRNLTKIERKRLATLGEKFPDIKPLLKFMTPDERRALNGQNVRNFLDVWDQLDPSEMASVALAGQAKRGWYEKSSKAIVDIFGDEDAIRFSGILAAMSPVTSVDSNLRNSLNMWVNWDRAGRPTDPDAISKIMGESVEGTKGDASVLGAWRQNTIDALSAPDASAVQLSGAKVDSFMRNIWGNMTEVTNDTWMAKYFGLDQTKFSSARDKNAAGESVPGKKTGVYLGINASTRKAAELLSRRTGTTWTPAEVQETIWSWSKSISDKANASNTPITDLIADLTNAEVAATPDFGTLLTQPGEFRAILDGGNFDGQRLDALAAGNSSAATVPTGTSASGTGIQPRHLNAAAERLEAARRAGQKPKAIDDLRASVDRSIEGQATPAFTRGDRRHRERNVEARFSLPADRVQRLNSLGVSTPVITELRNGAERFHKRVLDAQTSHPAGTQLFVYSPEEYANMRLFTTEDGKAGFALKGDDIVSVFNHSGSSHTSISAEMLMLAVEQGGRKLDAFDTYLPHLYESLGFQEVGRSPWNERLKPPGWDKKFYKKYNNGEPDVVFMEYRPTQKVIEEMAKKNGTLDLTQSPAPAQPISQNIDLSRFDGPLRESLG